MGKDKQIVFIPHEDEIKKINDKKLMEIQSPQRN